MRIVRACSLNGSDSVRVMTSRASNLFVQMLFMFREAFIIKDTVSAVTFIAKLIREFTFGVIIGRIVIKGKQWRIIRAVRAFGAGIVARVMTVSTIYHAYDGHREPEARNIFI
jgi:predicted membrane channel-forming protein YqfA (hemolysin III family)